MQKTNSPLQIKTIGPNGQLSLGKEFAGRNVMIDQVDEHTWIIKEGEFIPCSERWLYEADHLRKLEKALAWAEKNNPQDNFEQLAQEIEDDKHQN